MKKIKNRENGQALVTLLIFAITSVTITTAAILILAVNSISAQKMQEGILAKAIAESAVEDAILKIIRDPSYTGETTSLGGAEVVTSVSGSTSKTINTQIGINDFSRTVVVEVDFIDNVFTVLSWRELF